jgi:hypothetical protein
VAAVHHSGHPFKIESNTDKGKMGYNEGTRISAVRRALENKAVDPALCEVFGVKASARRDGDPLSLQPFSLSRSEMVTLTEQEERVDAGSQFSREKVAIMSQSELNNLTTEEVCKVFRVIRVMETKVFDYLKKEKIDGEALLIMYDSGERFADMGWTKGSLLKILNWLDKMHNRK